MWRGDPAQIGSRFRTFVITSNEFNSTQGTFQVYGLEAASAGIKDKRLAASDEEPAILFDKDFNGLDSAAKEFDRLVTDAQKGGFQKMTMMVTALGKFIPAEERILLIEDTAEIQLAHENLVRFEARREQNTTPAVTIRDLLKAALRHRPDRILLGEIRGGEAFDLLQLLNTGHSGTLSTIHASSARQGLARFTSCVLQSGVELPYRAIKTNVGDSLNVVVQIERRPGRRFISEVLEIKSYDPDADLYEFCVVYVAPREQA
jgi:Type II/IV secretion system protein